MQGKDNCDVFSFEVVKREHWGEDVPPIANCPCFEIANWREGKWTRGQRDNENPQTIAIIKLCCHHKNESLVKRLRTSNLQGSTAGTSCGCKTCAVCHLGWRSNCCDLFDDVVVFPVLKNLGRDFFLPNFEIMSLSCMCEFLEWWFKPMVIQTDQFFE